MDNGEARTVEADIKYHEDRAQLALEGLTGERDPFDVAFDLSRERASDERVYTLEFPPSDIESLILRETLTPDDYREMKSHVCQILGINRGMVDDSYDRRKDGYPRFSTSPSISLALVFDCDGQISEFEIAVSQNADQSNMLPRDWIQERYFLRTIPIDNVSQSTMNSLRARVCRGLSRDLERHALIARHRRAEEY